MGYGDPDLSAALGAFGDKVGILPFPHAEQMVLGQVRFHWSIRDTPHGTDWAAKDPAISFFHSTSLSLFSFLRTVS